MCSTPRSPSPREARVVAQRSEDVDGLSVDVEVRLSRLVVRCELDLPGGTLGLIGPSGAGKSTVLRAVAGLLRPNRGRIVLAGRRLFDPAKGIDLPPERRHIGLVFQDYALF